MQIAVFISVVSTNLLCVMCCCREKRAQCRTRTWIKKVTESLKLLKLMYLAIL